jgi:peptidoglycan/LPS O-acetylase OafA/YrhL
MQENRTNVALSGADPAGRRITVLDGWRGISILMVVVGHLAENRPHSSFSYRIADALSPSGVCIFFTISGFIITALALNEQRSSGEFSARRFYIRRFFRIVPPFFLYLALVLLAGALGLIAQSPRETLVAAAFTCNLPGIDCGWFAAHSWSLAYEEQFYLLFPLLFLLPERVIKTIVSVLFVVLVTLTITHNGLHVRLPWWAIMHATFYVSFLCAGVLLALNARAVQRFCGTPQAAYVAGCAALLFVGLMLLEAVSHDPHAGHRLVQARMLLRPILAPASIAVLLGCTLYMSNPATRLLDMRWLRFIGMISYSLYLWQQLFTAQPEDYPVRSMLMFPPLMFVCAILSYYWVERPCARVGKRFASPLQPRAVPNLVSSLPAGTSGRAVG